MNSLAESQHVAALADALYDFLPGKPHPRADQKLSFPGAATAVGVGSYWPGSSKKPSLIQLLSQTLDHARSKFCSLLVEIVKRAIAYRSSKNPLTRDEIEHVNEIVAKIGFKIPELWDKQFLASLPKQDRNVNGAVVESGGGQTVTPQIKDQLQRRFQEVLQLEEHRRGIAFEGFLELLFMSYNLAPRGAFSLVGEQIDGSFTLDAEVYLVEARWQARKMGNSELLSFSGKVDGKSRWARGLYVSYSGFTDVGLEAFQRGRNTNIICLDGLDLHQVLSTDIDLREALRRKLRRAAETSRAFVSVRELFHNVT